MFACTRRRAGPARCGRRAASRPHLAPAAPRSPPPTPTRGVRRDRRRRRSRPGRRTRARAAPGSATGRRCRRRSRRRRPRARRACRRGTCRRTRERSGAAFRGSPSVGTRSSALARPPSAPSDAYRKCGSSTGTTRAQRFRQLDHRAVAVAEHRRVRAERELRRIASSSSGMQWPSELTHSDEIASR